MIKNFSKMIQKAEDYLNSRPLINNDLIIDEYEITTIDNIGSRSIGSIGVEDVLVVNAKIKGVFDSKWRYLLKIEVRDYHDTIYLCCNGVTRL